MGFCSNRNCPRILRLTRSGRGRVSDAVNDNEDEEDVCLHQRPQLIDIGRITVQSKYRFEDNARILVLQKFVLKTIDRRARKNGQLDCLSPLRLEISLIMEFFDKGNSYSRWHFLQYVCAGT
ncbi:hypothetical protein RHSIM_Rhsim06G0101200 [Rhododendron simsii]|uniref:Uncharacterized protein n=1 Tax=Rhododendron simsii TaxID=118357 RepID=A0A834GY33_RHOSS|nr:hypothetical protein RHSIM_Rhsim06G0101200 [Rhododendron simsii]